MVQVIPRNESNQEIRFTVVLVGLETVREKFETLADAMDYAEFHQSSATGKRPFIEEKGYVPDLDLTPTPMVVRKYELYAGNNWRQVIKQRYEND